MRSFKLVFFSKYNHNDGIKEDDIGTAYSMNGGEDCDVQEFSMKARRKETTKRNQK
jgi:hypothetical protein